MPAIVHISDPHFGAHEQRLADSLLADIAEQEPDLIVVSGDWTQRARPSQFARARAFRDELPAPVLSVLGNHDLPLYDLPLRLASPTRRYREQLGADLDPVLRLEGLTVLGLDSMPRWRWKAGRLSARQAELVITTFADTPNDHWRVLVTHHPVLPAQLSGLLGRERVIKAAALSNVAVLLSGHVHTVETGAVSLRAAGVRREALGVVGGTAISRRTRGTPNSYVVLRLSGTMKAGSTIAAEVRQAEGFGWTTCRIDTYDFGEDGVQSREIR